MNRQEYMRKYKEENRIRLREYKKLWNRNKRAEFTAKGLTVMGTPFKVKDRRYKDKRQGHCYKCSILLASDYAKGGNERLCGMCLQKNPQ